MNHIYKRLTTLGSDTIILLKLLLPFVLLLILVSTALKALRGYENKPKKQLAAERKKTAKLEQTIEQQNERLEKLEHRQSDKK